MTTATHRRGAAHGAVPRWTRAAVVALVAVLALLVHHETAATVTHVPPAAVAHVPPAGAAGTGGMADPRPTAVPATSVHPGGHAAPAGVTVPAAAHDDEGACSGTTAQHCSAAGVDGLKFPLPHQPSPGGAAAVLPGAAAGRDVPGATGRAPPDLSVLSRLLL
jgi:hypothetical protein